MTNDKSPTRDTKRPNNGIKLPDTNVTRTGTEDNDVIKSSDSVNLDNVKNQPAQVDTNKVRENQKQI